MKIFQQFYQKMTSYFIAAKTAGFKAVLSSNQHQQLGEFDFKAGASALAGILADFIADNDPDMKAKVLRPTLEAFCKQNQRPVAERNNALSDYENDADKGDIIIGKDLQTFLQLQKLKTPIAEEDRLPVRIHGLFSGSPVPLKTASMKALFNIVHNAHYENSERPEDQQFTRAITLMYLALEMDPERLAAALNHGFPDLYSYANFSLFDTKAPAKVFPLNS